MEAYNPPDRSYKPHFVRPDVSDPDASSPAVKGDAPSSKRSHLHGIHHSPKRHHHRHHHRHSTKDSGTPTSLTDLLKQASRTSHHPPVQSRPPSGPDSVGKEERHGGWDKPTNARATLEHVEKERLKMKMREEELRSSLQALSEHSLKTSRRLDDTYYSLLEKAALLRQTIGNLQELSSLTKELHETFQSDTKECSEDMFGQIEAFNGFTAQGQQIEDLQARIAAGKDKASSLNERLAQARRKVEARADVEAEWEVRTSRRLRILWGVLGTILGLVLVVILVQHFRAFPVPLDPEASLSAIIEAKIQETPIPEPAKQILLKQSTTTPRPLTVSTPILPAPSSNASPGLHVFDEL